MVKRLYKSNLILIKIYLSRKYIHFRDIFFTFITPYVLIILNTFTKEVCNTLYNLLFKESQRLDNLISSITYQINSLPKGKLVCSRSGKYVKWLCSDGHKLSNIPKSNRILAQELAKKKLLEAQLSDSKKEKCAIDYYLRHHNTGDTNVDKLLAKDNEYLELLSDFFKPLSQELDAWMNASYIRSTKHPEHLIHKTCIGYNVRSKSESMICTYLSINKIPFRYECALTLGNKVYYPDFTIRHPKTGAIFYWEHLGLLEDAVYAMDNFDKLHTYSMYQIFPDKNLILTYEYEDQPLSSDVIEEKINRYFL